MIRVEGHFGELMQGRLGPSGPVVLLSLPCPALAVTGSVQRGTGLALHGSGQRLVTPARARRFLHDLGYPLTGRVILRARMPAGGGAGASTASLTALARLAGATDPDHIAIACLRSEGATDPLMFPDATQRLWASRSAETVSILPKHPPFDVIGGFFGAAQRTDPADTDFPDISDLVRRWPGADLAETAQIITTSARRTLKRRGPQNDPTEQIAQRLGALGWITAHTGSARGLIFPRGAIPQGARAHLIASGFKGVITFGAGQ